MFVNHLDSASIRRVDLAKFFTEYVNKQKDGVNPVKLRMHFRRSNIF